MGKLSCLKSLSFFIVGKKNGYQISDLKELNLWNQLLIKELDILRNLKESKNVNLIGKQNLQSLSLVWQSDSKHEDVLNGLKTWSFVVNICNYHGCKIHFFIYNLFQIFLEHCTRCVHLPCLGKLLFLKVLAINGMHVCEGNGGEYASAEWTGAEKRDGVTTWIRSRNHIYSTLCGRTNLTTRIWLQSLGTAWEGVTHLWPSDSWVGFYSLCLAS